MKEKSILIAKEYFHKKELETYNGYYEEITVMKKISDGHLKKLNEKEFINFRDKIEEANQYATKKNLGYKYKIIELDVIEDLEQDVLKHAEEIKLEKEKIERRRKRRLQEESKNKKIKEIQKAITSLKTLKFSEDEIRQQISEKFEKNFEKKYKIKI